MNNKERRRIEIIIEEEITDEQCTKLVIALEENLPTELKVKAINVKVKEIPLTIVELLKNDVKATFSEQTVRNDMGIDVSGFYGGRLRMNLVFYIHGDNSGILHIKEISHSRLNLKSDKIELQEKISAGENELVKIDQLLEYQLNGEGVKSPVNYIDSVKIKYSWTSGIDTIHYDDELPFKHCNIIK